MATEKRTIDWELVEKLYRAGILSNVQIATECGVTEGAIRKRAKRDGWVKDLQAKIKAKAAAKVSAAAVSKEVSAEKRANQNVIVEANAEIVSQADLINRKDVMLALEVSRSQLEEVAALSTRKIAEDMNWLSKTVRDSKLDQGMSPESVGRAIGLFDYILSLPGRVKISKEIAAAHGVYIPMQRKILKLDEEADNSQSSMDALMAKINAAAD